MSTLDACTVGSFVLLTDDVFVILISHCLVWRELDYSFINYQQRTCPCMEHLKGKYNMVFG
jgi:hypothetical protein